MGATITPSGALSAALLAITLACSDGAGTGAGTSGTSTGGGAGSGGAATAASSGSGATGGATPLPVEVSISAGARTPRTSTWSVSYWTWSPSYGVFLPGTEAMIKELAPALLRVGGYNNDANVPDPFDEVELDKAVAYARAIGAELLLQIPLLARADGERPTPQNAAAILSYANVTKGYAIRYVSIGNEPDLYPDQGGLTDPAAPAIPGYTPEQYCTEAAPIVAALKQVDPALEIVGPDLGYKYQSFADWLTPILQNCGDLFDVVGVHRYPFEALQTTPAAVAADPLGMPAWAADLRARMAAAGAGDKPLALTEMNLAYVASPVGYTSGSILGTVPHGLWVTDIMGQAARLGLWTAAHFDIGDPDEFALGLVGPRPEQTPRPAYYALLLYTMHTGPTLLTATTGRSDLRAYATRNADDSSTQLVLTNWSANPLSLNVEVTDLAATPGAVSVVIPPLSVNALVVPDTSAPSAWTYGESQHANGVGVEGLDVTR
jgi:hypothetical protein